MIRVASVAFVLGILVACGSDSDDAANKTTPAPPGTPPGQFGNTDGDAGTGNGNCVPPDMLITLDRTLTMHLQADGTEAKDPSDTKWTQAIGAIHTLVAAPRDTTIRFGLELWPKNDPACRTLAQVMADPNALNPACQSADILVPPDLGKGASIASQLNPTTTTLCFSTPTGQGLVDAKAALASTAATGKKQFVVLVTDGADWDLTCPDPNPLGIVDQLTAAGVNTVIVGFSAQTSVQGGTGRAFLNDMACAGGTAKGYPESCVKSGTSYRAKTDETQTLFYVATNADELSTALTSFASTVCCGCVK